MKANEVSIAIQQAHNDTIDAETAHVISNVGMDTRELTQEEIDELYNLLGTASVNIGSAMNKLRPNTTYYKENE